MAINHNVEASCTCERALHQRDRFLTDVDMQDGRGVQSRSEVPRDCTNSHKRLFGKTVSDTNRLCLPCASEKTKKTTIKGKRMSGKREQANEEFLEKLHGRATGALLQYFFSHGVCVDKSELNKAAQLAEHHAVFAELDSQLAQVNEAMKLLNDIGTLSLSAKEKAMRAVYHVEARLATRHGQVQGLERAIADLVAANEAAPRKPNLWPYAVCGSLFVAGALHVHALAAVGIVIYAIGFGKYQQFKTKRAASDLRIQDANRDLDQVVVREITPRNGFVLQ
ncbi:hypothetical protein [Paraburkholderia caledonica]|uniref:hypothetical protein n=1 Tax=Paraburkholderia caledonica TaxID=134536 RepID=UPI0011813B19